MGLSCFENLNRFQSTVGRSMGMSFVDSEAQQRHRLQCLASLYSPCNHKDLINVAHWRQLFITFCSATPFTSDTLCYVIVLPVKFKSFRSLFFDRFLNRNLGIRLRSVLQKNPAIGGTLLEHTSTPNHQATASNIDQKTSSGRI